MPKVIPKNTADEMTKPYINDAVDRQLKAADVPPRSKLDISFKDAGRTDDNKDYKSNQDAYEENHGKLYDMTHKNTIPWRNYVVYFVLLSLLTTVFTFSKYMSGANLSGDAIVAKFDYVISGNELDKSDVLINNNIWQPNTQTEFEIEDDYKVFEFTVQNKSDVTIDVMPECASTTEGSKFEFSFKNKGTDDAQLIDLNSTTGKRYIRINPGKTGKLYLWIDSTNVLVDTNEDLNLDFFIEQVD